LTDVPERTRGRCKNHSLLIRAGLEGRWGWPRWKIIKIKNDERNSLKW
jgi:hypothetical protein